MTLKLFATLTSCLPTGAKRNLAEIEVEPGTTIWSVLDHYHVPREKCHLVMLNGVFQAPEDRDTVTLKQDDVLAVWPPVAGG